MTGSSAMPGVCWSVRGVGIRGAASAVMGDDPAVRMERILDPEAELDWLAGRPEEESATGYDPAGWAGSIWILHAMYHNPVLDGLGTHDDIHRAAARAGTIAPLIIGEVNLEEVTTVIGTPVGFVVRPGSPWRRLLWRDHCAAVGFMPDRTYPPSDKWFPHRSWPVSMVAPPEGSLDDDSLDALIEVLAEHSAAGEKTECVVFYASLPARDFDSRHVWPAPRGDRRPPRGPGRRLFVHANQLLAH